MEIWLDLRTLAMAHGFTALLIGVVMTWAWPRSLACPGFRAWGVASLMVGVGMVLLALRDFIPMFWSTVVANLLVMLAGVLVNRGLVRVADERQSLAWDLLPFFMLLGLYAYHTMVEMDFKSRVSLGNLIFAVIYLRGMILALYALPEIMGRRDWWWVWAMGGMALVQIARGLYTLGFQPPTPSLVYAGPVHGAAHMFYLGWHAMMMAAAMRLNMRYFAQRSGSGPGA